MLLALGVVLLAGAEAIFFPMSGGGGGGCCCSCGTPQPPSCGCQPQCPPPSPCPVCVQVSCPPPPTAYCPQVQPVYVSACGGGGCGGGGGGNGGYATASGGGYAAAGGSYAPPPVTYAGASYAPPPPPPDSYIGGKSGGGGYNIGGGGPSYSTGGGGSGYGVGGGGSSYGIGGGVAPSYGTGGGGGGPSYNLGGSGTGSNYGPGGGGAAPVYLSGAGAPVGDGTSIQQPVPATSSASESNLSPPVDDIPSGAGAPASSNYSPPSNKLRSETPPPICEPAKVKYVVLRSKKVPGSGNEEMEEVEEINHPIEATASPLQAKAIGDDITRNEPSPDENDVQRDQEISLTFTDSKCNSKPLRDLIVENVVREDALASKRAIHEASLRKFPDSTVDVVCSGTGFTYLVSTTEHCEAQKDDVICFVYKRPLLRH